MVQSPYLDRFACFQDSINQHSGKVCQHSMLALIPLKTWELSTYSFQHRSSSFVSYLN